MSRQVSERGEKIDYQNRCFFCCLGPGASFDALEQVDRTIVYQGRIRLTFDSYPCPLEQDHPHPSDHLSYSRHPLIHQQDCYFPQASAIYPSSAFPVYLSVWSATISHTRWQRLRSPPIVVRGSLAGYRGSGELQLWLMPCSV